MGDKVVVPQTGLLTFFLILCIWGVLSFCMMVGMTAHTWYGEEDFRQSAVRCDGVVVDVVSREIRTKGPRGVESVKTVVLPEVEFRVGETEVRRVTPQDQLKPRPFQKIGGKSASFPPGALSVGDPMPVLFNPQTDEARLERNVERDASFFAWFGVQVGLLLLSAWGVVHLARKRRSLRWLQKLGTPVWGVVTESRIIPWRRLRARPLASAWKLVVTWVAPDYGAQHRFQTGVVYLSREIRPEGTRIRIILDPKAPAKRHWIDVKSLNEVSMPRKASLLGRMREPGVAADPMSGVEPESLGGAVSAEQLAEEVAQRQLLEGEAPAVHPRNRL